MPDKQSDEGHGLIRISIVTAKDDLSARAVLRTNGLDSVVATVMGVASDKAAVIRSILADEWQRTPEHHEEARRLGLPPLDLTDLARIGREE